MSLTATTNFTGHFLIAMPSMDGDPTFTRALILVCEHNEHGALGIMVNRPLDLTLGGLFERVHAPPCDDDRRSFAGVRLRDGAADSGRKRKPGCYRFL